MNPPPRPVAGHPVLLLPEGPAGPAALAVADLHLGLGYGVREGVGLADVNARAMAEELCQIAARERARAVLVAGDAKHPLLGAPGPIGPMLFDFFSTLLSSGLAVEVVRGNHDVGIDRHLPREVRVHPAGGLRRGDVGLFHGHAWPEAGVLDAPVLVAGHLHPGFRLAGEDGHAAKRRCWVRAELTGGVPRAPRSVGRSAGELIVLPAFNPLSGIEALNKSAPARGRTFLVNRFLAQARSRAYLLDGTDLGALSWWGERRAPPRAPRAPRSGRGSGSRSTRAPGSGRQPAAN